MADSSMAGRESAREGSDSDVVPTAEELVRQHHEALYRYAYRLTGATADAEDLTQHTFLVAQQKLHQLRDPGSVRSWLFAVLRNGYLKGRRKLQPQAVVDLELDINLVAEQIPDDDQIDRELLQTAIDELPPEFKVVMVMFYFEDRAYTEIAEELEIPLGTVMSRLWRGKSHLRRRLRTAQVSTR